MNERKEYRKTDRRDDVFDDWFGEFLPRRWGSFPGMFTEFDENFRKMEMRMNRLLRDASSGKLPSLEEGGPYVYGWTFRKGPEGEPEFREFGNVPALRGMPKEMIGSREPLADLNETDDMINVTVEIPGISKDKINLEILDKSLVIEVMGEERKYYKEIALSSEVEGDSAKATYRNGVLDIELKKVKPKREGKKISIN